MNQLFLISDEAWEAADPLEVNRICEDLRALNLYALPYPIIDIGVSVDAAVTFVDNEGNPTTALRTRYRDQLINGKSVPPLGPDVLLVYRNICLSGDACHAEMIGPWPGIIPTGTPPQPAVRLALINLLIALLATRNTRREVKENKLAGLGIGKKKSGLRRYRYITTLHPPEAGELHDEAGSPVHTGRKRIPHLRRGHIRRNQHYGPNRQFTRSVWIEPMFINASDEIIATREAYNFSIRGASPLNLEQQSQPAPAKETTQPCKSTQKLSSEETSPSSSSSSSQSS